MEHIALYTAISSAVPADGRQQCRGKLQENHAIQRRLPQTTSLFFNANFCLLTKDNSWAVDFPFYSIFVMLSYFLYVDDIKFTVFI